MQGEAWYTGPGKARCALTPPPDPALRSSKTPHTPDSRGMTTWPPQSRRQARGMTQACWVPSAPTRLPTQASWLQHLSAQHWSGLQPEPGQPHAITGQQGPDPKACDYSPPSRLLQLGMPVSTVATARTRMHPAPVHSCQATSLSLPSPPSLAQAVGAGSRAQSAGNEVLGC